MSNLCGSMETGNSSDSQDSLHSVVVQSITHSWLLLLWVHFIKWVSDGFGVCLKWGKKTLPYKSCSYDSVLPVPATSHLIIIRFTAVEGLKKASDLLLCIIVFALGDPDWTPDATVCHHVTTRAKKARGGEPAAWKPANICRAYSHV